MNECQQFNMNQKAARIDLMSWNTPKYSDPIIWLTNFTRSGS